MTDTPERIFVEDEFGDGDDDQWVYGCWDIRKTHDYIHEYVHIDKYKALEARVQELEAASVWQPIESGKIPFAAEGKLSVWLTNHGPVVGTMITNDNGFREKDWRWWVVYSTPSSKGKIRSSNITHWQPLPTPPKEA